MKAKKRYETFLKGIGGFERLVSASDDFTLFMWKPESEKKPVCRLTGHQATINDVKFSPDARYIASASFDKSVCLGLFTPIFTVKNFWGLILEIHDFFSPIFLGFKLGLFRNTVRNKP